MTASRTLHLHIGLPKTASTWLQQAVFPRLDHLVFRDSPRSALFRAEGDREAGHRALPCAFRRSTAVWRSCGDALLAEMLGPRDAWRAERRDLLVSDEGIGRTGSRPELLAAHLQALRTQAEAWGFARLAVICLVRRQDRWLASHYAQMSDRRPRASQADFERMVATSLDPTEARYGFGMLIDYGELRDRLSEALGPGNLTLLPYEALGDDPGAFLGRLLSSLGTPPGRAEEVVRAARDVRANVRSSDEAWRLRPRRLRLPLPGGSRSLGVPRWAAPGRGSAIRLDPSLSRRVLDAYEASNRRLAAAEGLDLARHGYFGSAETASAGLFGDDPHA